MPPTTGTSEHARVSEVGKAMLMAGLVLLVSVAVLLFGAYDELRSRNAEIQRGNVALLRLKEISSLVIGVDYSARGYALTGQKLFLEHEYVKQARLKEAVKGLADIVEPGARSEAAKLADLADRHARIYAEYVVGGPGRTKELAAIITNPVLRQRRYDVLNLLERLEKAQIDALYAHQAAAEYQMRYAGLLTFGIVILAFLGGIVDLMSKIFGARRQT